MIAEACITSSLPPEAFGVEASPELGAVMIEVLVEQARESRLAARRAEMGSR